MRLTLPVALVSTVATGVLALTGAAGQADASTAPTHTHRVVVRPVDTHGHPVAGWTVKRESGVTASCDGPSAAAVSANIVACFPSAEYLPACWKSGHHTVLCLRDARTRTLVRIRYTGSLPQVSAPKQPSPLDLRLTHHQGCTIRVGGAWGTLPSHPRWVGFYSCDRGSVYGPPSGDGINRSQQPWTVHVWKSGTKQRVVVRQVRTAYYVGTHR